MMFRSIGTRAGVFLLALFSVAPAWSEEPVPAPAPSPSVSPTPAPAVSGDTAPSDRTFKLQEIEAAIAQQEKRRSNAKAGFVIAGMAIVGGVIASAVQSANEEEQKAEQTGQYSEEVEINWTGFGIGVLIAAPIIATSVSTLRDANRQSAQLNRQRRQLTLAPANDGLRLTMAFDF